MNKEQERDENAALRKIAQVVVASRLYDMLQAAEQHQVREQDENHETHGLPSFCRSIAQGNG